jgi:flagellar biosynthetic protein FlhB
MADGGADRTEKPTPKRLKEGRKQGQVPRSQDLAAWAGVLAVTFVLPGLVSGVSESLTTLFARLPDVMAQPSIEGVMPIVTDAASGAALACIPMLAVVTLAAVVAGVAQGGTRPYGTRLKPKFARVSPLQGFKRMFGAQGAWELVKSLLKTGVVGWLAYRAVMSLADLVMGSGSLPLGATLATVGASAMSTIRIVAVAALLLGVADYFVSRRRVNKQMLMSRKDIKDEMKQAEGDPMVKASLRRRAMMIARNRMMADVATADVVMVNPTHVAVALRYSQGLGAPRVVAKGAGAVAARIRELAAENRVPMVEDVPLARALYKACDVGEEIPADFYTAVAQVLAFVMGLRARGAAAGLHRNRSLALSRR